MSEPAVRSSGTSAHGLLLAAGICGMLGVLAGTFGAHGLKGRLTDAMLANFETGVRYHLIHTVAILALALWSATSPPAPARLLRSAGWCMTAGIAVFAGSLYAMALLDQRWLGLITPIGGTAFIAGWALIAAAGWMRVRSTSSA